MVQERQGSGRGLVSNRKIAAARDVKPLAHSSSRHLSMLAIRILSWLSALVLCSMVALLYADSASLVAPFSWHAFLWFLCVGPVVLAWVMHSRFPRKRLFWVVPALFWLGGGFFLTEQFYHSTISYPVPAGPPVVTECRGYPAILKALVEARSQPFSRERAISWMIACLSLLTPVLGVLSLVRLCRKQNPGDGECPGGY